MEPARLCPVSWWYQASKLPRCPKARSWRPSCHRLSLPTQRLKSSDESPLRWSTSSRLVPNIHGRTRTLSSARRFTGNFQSRSTPCTSGSKHRSSRLALPPVNLGTRNWSSTCKICFAPSLEMQRCSPPPTFLKAALTVAKPSWPEVKYCGRSTLGGSQWDQMSFSSTPMSSSWHDTSTRCGPEQR